jgi:hypothetical protein
MLKGQQMEMTERSRFDSRTQWRSAGAAQRCDWNLRTEPKSGVTFPTNGGRVPEAGDNAGEKGAK